MASRGRPSKRGTPFDRLIKQQCQKGRFGMGVNKSAGMVHGKWGAASFTSLRTANGTGVGNVHSISQPSKVSKFFKSRDTLPQQSHPQLPETNMATHPSTALQSNNKSTPSNDRKMSSNETKMAVDDASSSQNYKNSLKRHKYAEEDQLQQVAEEVPAKKAGKRFFTSKQRKQEQQTIESHPLNTNSAMASDGFEDRENLPRVPPLKLRLKAANAAAQSTTSFSDHDGSDVADKRIKNITPKINTGQSRSEPQRSSSRRGRQLRSIESRPVEAHQNLRSNRERQHSQKYKSTQSKECSGNSNEEEESAQINEEDMVNEIGEIHSQAPLEQSVPGTDSSKVSKSKSQAQSESPLDAVPAPSKGNRKGGRKRGQTTTQILSESSTRKTNNGIHAEYGNELGTDVPDVAGGTRNHRKLMQHETNSLESSTSAVRGTTSDTSTRATRSSRSRAAGRTAVNYNESTSDAYLDDVCESEHLDSIAIGERNTIIASKSDEAAETFCPSQNSNSKTSSISFKHKAMHMSHNLEEAQGNVKNENEDKQLEVINDGRNQSDTAHQEWTMKEVDQFYTKMDDVAKQDEQKNTNANVKNCVASNNTDATDKGKCSYMRKRKEKQGIETDKVENMGMQAGHDCNQDETESKFNDVRIPNQEDITKMAATSNNNACNQDTALPNIENSQLTKAFNSTANSKSSNAFSIKVLADLKDEEDAVQQQHETHSVRDLNALTEESNTDPSTKPGSKRGDENLEEDSDFYTKLMESKSQLTQRAPVKSFSFSSRQSGSATSTNFSTIPPNQTKKRSIFKSKLHVTSNSGGINSAGGNGNGNQAKARSLYKHKWSSNTDEGQQEEKSFRDQLLQRALTVPSTSGSSLDFGDDFGEPSSATEMPFSSTRLVRVPTVTGSSSTSSVHSGFDETLQEVVSVKCPKAEKNFYHVIKKTKKAHQIQDSGEFQEFNDDVEYILEGLESHNSLSTRCLSTVTLASKCMEPPFRMHLRAHGTVTKFFSELMDAPKNPSLALCTSTVLFVLSQDRLNMDLDRESLELMLNLLDTDSRIKDALDGAGMSKRELEKNKSKVQELVAAMKAKGRATNLSLDHISADHLAMETLLSMTSKRAGEWFKEELRELGGLDHLVSTMSDCLAFLTADEISMWTEPLHNKLKKVDRVLKVLESVTHENEENCQYLLEFQEGKFLSTIHSFYKLLDEEVPLNSNLFESNSTQAVIDKDDKDSIAYTLRESLLDVIRVYINLVHDYRSIPLGSRLSGEKEGTFDLCLHGLFVLPSYFPEEKRFDIVVLTLTLIINLVENCKPNRGILMKTFAPQKSDEIFTNHDRKLGPAGLIQMFIEREENARRLETKTDKILDGKGDEDEAVPGATTEKGFGAPSSGSNEKGKIGNVEQKAEEQSTKTDTHASYGSKAKSGTTSGKAPPSTGPNSNSQKSHEEFIDETVKKLLEKAGSHMEDTLVASYLTLIIGYLIYENADNEKIVRQWMPENDFKIMVAVLKKFFNFMNLTASASVTSTRGLKATEMILKYMETADKEPEENKKENIKVDRSSIDLQGESFDDITLFEVTKEEEEDLDDTSIAGSRSDRSRNSESSFLDMKSPNFDDFGKL